MTARWRPLTASIALPVAFLVGCTATESNPGATGVDPAEAGLVQEIRAACATHPMGRCLAAHGYTDQPLVLTRQEYQRTFQSSWNFPTTLAIVTVGELEPSRPPRDFTHIAGTGDAFDRSISVEPWQRLGCDMEVNGITLMWDG